jgi:hypothetical protein
MFLSNNELYVLACARKGRFRCALSAINTAIANLVAAVQAFEEANKGTGISVVKAATGKEVWYDMNGRRVAQPTKGLYIVNGKKVVVK